MTITEMPQPVIARIHGIATAAGCQLVAMCDLAVAADTKFSPCPASTSASSARRHRWRWARAMGRKQAMEMLLTGRVHRCRRGAAARPGQSRRAAGATRCRSEEAHRLDLREVSGRRRHGEADVLQATGNGARRRLPTGLGNHGLQHDGRGRDGRNRCVPTGAGYESGALLGSRLFPDMFDLTRQVQIATDQAKGGAARLAGVDVPKYEDNETTFAELDARISKTIQFLETIRPDQVDGSEGRDIVIQAGPMKLEFKGQIYLTTWVFPNFFFHVTTAYNILRHNGVPLSKRDFLGM
jgi:hypothetical protein